MWLRRCVVGALLLTVADAIVVGSAPSARVVALGDVHGDFQQTVRVLKMARVIDNQHRWIGGDTTLVQLGDILDRGTEERELWDFFLRLRDEAPLAGGKVVQLLGNHEVLNVLGQAGNYVHPEGYMQFGEDRCAAFMPGSEYATLLAECPVVAIVGDSVFSHASLPTDATLESLAWLNAETRHWLLGQRPQGAPYCLSHGGRESPVWDRTFSSPRDRAVADDKCATLDATLSRLGVSRLVVGHTPQESINCACEGAVWRIDTGASRWVMDGACQALEIACTGEVRILSESDQVKEEEEALEKGVVVPVGKPLLTGEEALHSPTCAVDDESGLSPKKEAELEEACGSGDGLACDTLAREEEAKRAWLARLDAPWGPKQEAVLEEACISGDDVACDMMTRENDAKRAWLKQLNAPQSGLEDAFVNAVLARHAAAGDKRGEWSPQDEEALARMVAEACISGDDEACNTLSRENEAKRAWLARLDAPTWGPKQEAVLEEACISGDDVACDTLSREDEAKRAWLAQLNPPKWGAKEEAALARMVAEACNSGDDEACGMISRESDAKRAWLERLDVPAWGPKKGETDGKGSMWSRLTAQ